MIYNLANGITTYGRMNVYHPRVMDGWMKVYVSSVDQPKFCHKGEEKN